MTFDELWNDMEVVVDVDDMHLDYGEGDFPMNTFVNQDHSEEKKQLENLARYFFMMGGASENAKCNRDFDEYKKRVSNET